MNILGKKIIVVDDYIKVDNIINDISDLHEKNKKLTYAVYRKNHQVKKLMNYIHSLNPDVKFTDIIEGKVDKDVC